MIPVAFADECKSPRKIITVILGTYRNGWDYGEVFISHQGFGIVFE